jgi:hypothetical protein
VQQQWIQNIHPNALRVEVILHKLHYKFAIILVLGDLKVIVDGDLNTMKLLMDIVPLNMALLSTIDNFDGECPIWKGLDWKCLLTSLLNCKVCFQFVICICDRKAFLHLFAIVTKYQFSLKFQLEFGQYMVTKTKVLLGKETFMETLLLFYAYLFFDQVGVNIKDILGSKSLLSLVRSIGFPFPSYQRLYKYEICFKALKTTMDPILQSGMEFFSVYKEEPSYIYA